MLLLLVLGSVCEVSAAPSISRIMRKNNNLQGHRDGISRGQEPAYKTPKYYPDYGSNKGYGDSGWQRVRDNTGGANRTPSYGTGGPRAPRRRY